MKKILITGSAGFIGFHVTRKLLEQGFTVVGLDNLNDYYSVSLKKDRLRELGIARDELPKGMPSYSTVFPDFSFYQLDLADTTGIEALFDEHLFDGVIHLAAQAGVRYSIDHPHAYISSNVAGFLNILEGCRHAGVSHLVFASSSSVYGLNETTPFSENDNVDHPISLYAATKKSNELMAHTYSYLFGLPVTGLRFFTVYGPWGRPDMSYFLFTKAILEGKPIKLFNNGHMERDFTYVDDVVKGIQLALTNPAKSNPHWKGSHPTPSSSKAPYRIYNLGNNKPVRLMDFVAALENAMDQKAIKEYLPMQPGDVQNTMSDIHLMQEAFGYSPETNVDEGLSKFVSWYYAYHKIKKQPHVFP